MPYLMFTYGTQSAISSVNKEFASAVDGHCVSSCSVYTVGPYIMFVRPLEFQYITSVFLIFDLCKVLVFLEDI
jgi:Kef-type K+ transport system membrane component KefB